MNIIFGILMVFFGLFLVVSASTKSEFVVYRLLVARSKLLWRSRVHLFHQVAGSVIVALGLLWSLGLIWKVA